MTKKRKISDDVRKLTMEIDHRQVSFPEGVSVLRAAELNDVYVPSLCSHKDLSPFGGCRMCVVEIEGMRGYPLACSTTAQAGMKVLTETAVLREMRREVLQLILSEHPSSCLVCDENEECRQYQTTIRKAGVTTGCRYCPNDNQCELQEVVKRVGLTEINYPVSYRGYEAEHDDPFFDRDYNLCILCGRCVRMCQEVRGTAVLAFNHRGPNVKIGPAFGNSHTNAGCEFCGACVSVCPTGSLAEKSAKWDGKQDGIEVSTCPFCCIGCRVELHHKDGRLSKVHPNLDEEVNDGQLCVRGRFCMPETTHHHERARRPMVMRGKYFRESTWEEALEEVGAQLKGVKPEEFLMLVSPDLTNEGIYSAQKFVRSVMGSNGIDSTARTNLPGGLDLWRRLFSLPISIKGISEADSIIAVGLDSRFQFSVAGVRIRSALKRGAELVTIDARESNLARYTDNWLNPRPGGEGAVLNMLAKAMIGKKVGTKSTSVQTGVDEDRLNSAVEVLKKGARLAVILGPRAFEYSGNSELLEAVFDLAKRPDTVFLPLYHGANTRGAVELGAFGELLPGAADFKGRGISLADVSDKRKRPKVLYLVGQTPFQERPDCDYLICQDIYYPPFAVDAFLPAASFAEAGGTLTNVEGRVQEVARIECLPEGAVNGFMRPDWQIFSDLSERVGSKALGYKSEADVLKEIHKIVPDFPMHADRQPRQLKYKGKSVAIKSNGAPEGEGEFLLVLESSGFQHRGIDLSRVVEGLGELALEKGLRLNPEDLTLLGVKAGDEVTVSIEGNQISVGTRADDECPRGAAYLYRYFNFGGAAVSRDMELLRYPGSNPVRVRIK